MYHAPKAVAGALAAGFLITTLAGCSSTSGSGSSGEKTIAYFAPSLGIGYWQNVGYGVKEEAKKLGYKYVSYNANNSDSTQLSNMNNAVTAEVTGIVIGPTSSTSLPPLLAIAKKNHIPIAFAGIGPGPGQNDYTSAITADNEGTGKAEGKYICDGAKAKGGNKVGMLSLPQDRENAQLYLKGAKEAFATGGCDLVQVVQTKGLTVQEAVQETQDLLTAHPDITGIYGMYDEAGIGAVQVLKSEGKLGKIVVATADGSPATVKLVRDKDLDALFLQQAVGQGIDGTQQVVFALKGKKTTKQITPVEPMVTPANIDDPSIQAQLKRVYPPSAGAY